MENVNADGLDGVQMKVLSHGVAIERPYDALLPRNRALLRLVGLPPHELQGVGDAIHRSLVGCKIELPITEIVLGNTADVAGFPRAAAGSLAVAEGTLNGRVGIDRHDARTDERL